MRIAQDAIPGQIIPMWFKPIKTGTFEVVCGQLCGLGHYGMKGTLVVDTPADYQAWLKERVELSGTKARRPAAVRRRTTGCRLRESAAGRAAGRRSENHEPGRRIGKADRPSCRIEPNDAHARRRNQSLPSSLCLASRRRRRSSSFAAAEW